MIRLGDNIKYLRNKKRLSQRELAKILCLSRNQIASYEYRIAEPSIKTLIDLANFFDVSIDDLIRSDIYKILQKKIKNEHNCN